MHHRNSQRSHYAGLSALGLALALAGCASKPACENDSMAFALGNDFIRQQLKAPASASFPSSSDPGVAIIRTASTKGKACAFSISTYVDSQNSFGAQIRTNFNLTVAPDNQDGTSWSLEGIQAF